MNATQVEMAISVLQILTNSIQTRLSQQSELIKLFNKANEENRDFTREEMLLWKAKAEAALKDLEELLPEL